MHGRGVRGTRLQCRMTGVPETLETGPMSSLPQLSGLSQFKPAEWNWASPLMHAAWSVGILHVAKKKAFP